MGGYSKQEIKDFGQKVEDQIQFLEYFLNTVGSGQTPARDKDVIITESYKKIFRDNKVQVEDDLVLDRQVITNKDVTAYLKDVEFFFKDASFKFKVRDVKPFLRDNGELSFSVSLDRTLSAVGLDNEKIENTKPRFVEVNLDRQSNELKIASIYTTKLSRDKELMEWWGALSYQWTSFFRKEFSIAEEDSITVDHLNKISALDSLDLSGNAFIQDLNPLEALRDLKYVDISNTMIRELGPISNVTFLSYLDVSNTPTEDIQFIKYAENLAYLDISNTLIENIDDLSNLSNLKVLKASNTPLMSFAAMNSFEALEELNLEQSGFNNLESINELNQLKKLDIKGNYLINFNFLANLEALEEINLSRTNIKDLTPLKDLSKLKVLNINETEVNSLSPMDGKTSLQKVYADRTGIAEDQADEFARNNRSVLLIHNVENLQTWWDTLPEGWKAELSKGMNGIQMGIPTIEQVSSIVGVDSLDISGSEIISLRPVLKFKKLVSLKFDDTKVHDLSPVRELKTIKRISGNNSIVTNVEDLENLGTLEFISLKNSGIASIGPLSKLKKLTYLDVDGTDVPEWEVQGMLQVVPQACIIYRSEQLKAWWNGLDGVWKSIFVEQFGLDPEPDTKELHLLTSSREVVIKRKSINSLRPLVDFVNLQSLSVHDVPLYDISDIPSMELLQKLEISQSPISELEAIGSLKNLESLNLSNTGVEDLRPLETLTKLKTLIISGTGVKRLKGLETLGSLEELDIASTNVRSIRPIEELTNLKRLICFNTRINSRQIDSFKEANPDCDVRYY
ncbi:hypothetical protein GCM10028791_25190 [Echinicola sediminis]